MKYLRYLGLPILVVIGIYFTAKGQYWAWLYLLLLDSIIIGGDAFLGDDRINTQIPISIHINSALIYQFTLDFSFGVYCHLHGRGFIQPNA